MSWIVRATVLAESLDDPDQSAYLGPFRSDAAAEQARARMERALLGSGMLLDEIAVGVEWAHPGRTSARELALQAFERRL